MPRVFWLTINFVGGSEENMGNTKAIETRKLVWKSDLCRGVIAGSQRKLKNLAQVNALISKAALGSRAENSASSLWTTNRCGAGDTNGD